LSRVASVKTGFIDLAAALFVIGGVVSLVINILTIPIASLYPPKLPESFGFVPTVVLIVSLICSLGAINCYSLVSRRQLSMAGMRGIIFGALLLTFSLGLIGTAARELNSQIGVASSILVLIAGAISFVLRESVLPRPPMMLHQQLVPQRPLQP
jgi:hypothetical protein